jgi:hypothetical protein
LTNSLRSIFSMGVCLSSGINSFTMMRSYSRAVASRDLGI